MPSSKKTITVRLSLEELAEIRKIPGDSSAARLRTLIHSAGAMDGLADKIATEVSKHMAVLLVKSLTTSETRITQDLRRALDTLASQLAPIFTKLLSNTTR